jgi:uncharacterized protein (DUF58 family)
MCPPSERTPGANAAAAATASAHPGAGAGQRRPARRLRAGPAAGSLALGLGLVGVGGLLDTKPLFAAGIAFALASVLATVWVLRAAADASVVRELSTRRVVEQETVHLRVEARRGRGILPGGELRDPLLPSGMRVPLGRRAHAVRIEARFARRGRRRLAPPQLLVRDPFALATRLISGGEPDELLVLPRTERVVLAAGAGAGASQGLARLLAPIAETEIDGLRPHPAGAPASRIHWPALARGAGLMERRLRGEVQTRALIVLDARVDADADAIERLDCAVRATASLCLALAPAGSCALLIPGERRPRALGSDLAGWPGLHARLALVEPATSGAAGPLLAAHAGAIVYVSARALARAPKALATARATTRFLVIPGRLDGRAPRFAVSGCSGYELGRSAGRRAA